jgi:peptidoglycan/LPS O-acetylase OafA/YrhL
VISIWLEGALKRTLAFGGGGLAAAVAPETRADEGRIGALDSLRGLAALVVVFNHCKLLFPNSRLFENTPLRLMVNGTAPVMLFFVLSGTVLALSYLEKDRSYTPYIIKRLSRIYLPFSAAIVLAAALDMLVGHAPILGETDWFNVYNWRSPVTLGLIGRHLAMLNVTELDDPMWSLVHEMRISLIFPLIAILAARRWRFTLLITGLASAMATLLMGRLVEGSLAASILSTVQFIALFAVGAVLSLPGKAAIRRTAQLGPGFQAAALAASLILLGLAPWSGGHIVGLENFAGVTAAAFGSAILIMLALGDAPITRAVLNHPIPLFLGKISYSLYLTHVIVLEVLVRTLAGHAPLLGIVALVPVAAIPAAWMFNIAVERTSTRLGRRWAKLATVAI